MQRSIVGAYPDVSIFLYIVWSNRLEDDSEESADQAAKNFVEDPRVIHFYDPKQRIGKMIAKSLDSNEDEGAWDVYLFYRPGKEWLELPPTPDEWMHQLFESEWADPAHYHTGEDLAKRLGEVMDSLA